MLQTTQVIDWNELTNSSECYNGVTASVTQKNPSKIYVSTHLEAIAVPSGLAGRWLMIDHVSPRWHRLLDVSTYLWLRSQVRTAIQSGCLADQAPEALSALAAIESAGLQSGQLTAVEIAEHCRTPSSYIWADGIPRWAEWVDEAWR